MAKTLGDITGELTEKVLGPARADAERLVAEARQEADRILTAARQEAERTREAAKQEVEALKKQMDVDMETAARNFMIMLEERIEGAVVAPVIDETFRPLLSDREFSEKMILEL
jgi:V/A-type H+-transporting ATPase subunit E